MDFRELLYFLTRPPTHPSPMDQFETTISQIWTTKILFSKAPCHDEVSNHLHFCKQVHQKQIPLGKCRCHYIQHNHNLKSHSCLGISDLRGRLGIFLEEWASAKNGLQNMSFRSWIMSTMIAQAKHLKIESAFVGFDR